MRILTLKYRHDFTCSVKVCIDFISFTYVDCAVCKTNRAPFPYNPLNFKFYTSVVRNKAYEKKANCTHLYKSLMP